jgi:hypothetical protein
LKGQTGSAGTDGVPGVKGWAGDAALAGNPGLKGNTAPKGHAGLKGVKGVQGAPGPLSTSCDFPVVDLALALDSSNSYSSAAGWYNVTTFAANLVNSMPIAWNNSR